MDNLKCLEDIKKICSWIKTYGTVSKLIKENNFKKIIEIGVAYGFHSEYILKNNQDVEYIGIDPYISSYDERDCFAEDVRRFFQKESQQDALDVLCETVKTKMEPYGDRFKIIRSKFKDCQDQIENNSIDLIFVDGDHTYNGVMEDLEISWKKINKNGGILCGDDIGQSRVKKACDDFFKGKKVEYKLESINNSNYYWVYRFPKA
jgi:predicted O-methyltransferase YrrM